MYDTPQKSDFERNATSITQRSEAEAHAERLRIVSDAVVKGAAQSNRIIIAVIIPFEKIYCKAVEDTMQLIRDFVERTSLTATELGDIARMELGSFADRLLGQLPDGGFPQDAARIRGEYREKFRQLLEGALRDIQIGFIGGRKVTTAITATPNVEATNATLSEAVILKPTLWGMGIDLPKVWKWVHYKWRNTRR
jgi:hypothetical protein